MTEALLHKLKQGLQALCISYHAGQLQQIQRFVSLLQQWNSVYNLVADSSTDVVLVRHIFDSLSISPYIAGDHVLDLGSGAGFPGLPLAVFHPDTDFILLDSNGRKTRFLWQAKQALGLERVAIEHCRMEHYQSARRIDIVTCRAVASLPDMVKKSAAMLATGSRLLAMKGRYPEQEIKALPPACRVIDVQQLTVPGTDATRHLIRLEQVAQGLSDFRQATGYR